MELSDRKKQILKEIVGSYIDTGEPVGSKLIATKHSVGLSSATIRNEMAELEELGLLEQPHTSAGRIPTSTGYREYVDNLMQFYKLTMDEIKAIDDKMRFKLAQLDSIIEQSGKVMSQLSQMTAVAMLPRTSGKVITRFETVPVDNHSFLLVMIMTGNTLKTRHIKVGLDMDEESVRRVAAVLNEKMSGLSPDSVSLSAIMEMEHRMGEHAAVISPITKLVYQAVNEDDRSQLFVEGVNNLLKYPEYQDVNKAREILQVFEERQPILKMLDVAPDDKVNVFIGDEHTITSHDDMSLIFKKLSFGGKGMGGIGIIGPKRMDYPKIIARLDYCAQLMSGLLLEESDDKDTT
ncbi:MAG: heat-inducible transcriptional repressor HrcA [Eubacteriales bacterium]